MKLRSAASVWALVLLGAFTAACDVKVGEKGGISLDVSGGKATDEWSRAYRVSAGGHLDIVNMNGAINVSAGTGPQVEVRAEREAKAPSDEAAAALLAASTIGETVAPDRVSLETRQPGQRQRGTHLTVVYDVQVPPGMRLSLRTTNGAIRLTHIDGHISASTTNGNINGVLLKGGMKGSTVNGGVRVGFDSLAGDVDVTAVNGSIRVDLPPDARAQVDGRTTNGSVNVDAQLNLSAAERSRTRVVGTLNEGGSRIVAQTTNGGIGFHVVDRGTDVAQRDQPKVVEKELRRR